MIDLHTHSVFSDGTTTPEENVRLAQRSGLSGLALTDHDTLQGWPRADRAAQRAGIDFVPGVELSCELDGRGVHLLGYWVDADDAALSAECDRLRQERDRRAGEIIDLLARHGVHVDPAAVRARAAGAPLGRPHVAAVLVDMGVVADVDAAFDEWLGDGRPAFAQKRALSPVDGVRLLRGAGGVAVIAHPGVSEVVTADLVAQLAAAGLAGVEGDHAAHDDDQVRYWRAVAAELGLAVTGSSDFHGERKDARIGQRTTPRAVVDRLRAHCLQVRAV